MPTNSITIKANNHRIYQCPNEKKITLIQKLIQENKAVDILIVCAQNADTLRDALNDTNVRVMEDKELIKEKELSCDFLISYDMPIKAIVYMARVSKAQEKAVMLLDESEQNELYSIEMLLGRTIKQETLEGFMYEVAKKENDSKPTHKKLTKDEITEIARKRHENATTDNHWDKKKKSSNKFLGKDENGKAIFSGKSGERNHRYDGTPKERYDAPKKVGRKIQIKEIKPKEETE